MGKARYEGGKDAEGQRGDTVSSERGRRTEMLKRNGKNRQRKNLVAIEV